MRVIIEPNYNMYYPQKEFNFTADVFNQDHNRIDCGYVDIYIDNVREIENVPVRNGQINTRMTFNRAKTYKIDLIYYDDDGYYEETSYSYNFIVDRIDINNITIEYKNDKLTKVEFDTIDNYNVDDGILYVYIDDVNMGIYNIAEGHKYIDLDVLVPFEFLQCYEWESLNEEIATVNYIGQVTGVSTGTTQIIGTYKYNRDVVIIVTVNVD